LRSMLIWAMSLGFGGAFRGQDSADLSWPGDSERLKPRAKPYVKYEADLTAFGVAVYPSGIKS
jgi:hypothetical protein